MMHDETELVWKALADPSRRRILDLLRQRPQTTGELCASFSELSRFAIMKHLTVLELAGLVLIERKGRERYNYLNFVPLQAIYERWFHAYEADGARSLIQIKHQAEGASMSQPIIQEIEQSIRIQANAEAVYQSILDVNGWWGHRYARVPDSLRLEAKVGGRFWESRDGTEENGVLWGTVTGIEPNQYISITGSIGMPDVVLGSFTMLLNLEADGSTSLKLSHKFMGLVPERFVTGFTAGWQAHLDSLKALSETGARVSFAEE
jgi:DNA-binding transcriptional ArsR family regulator/uncharacterized protein YndB with AHSA1/START domain